MNIAKNHWVTFKCTAIDISLQFKNVWLMYVMEDLDLDSSAMCTFSSNA